MRKTIAATAATGALLFGGAGVAQATVDTAPSTSTVAQSQDNMNDNNKSDKTGLWGLLGLLGLGGLGGLRGLRRRDDAYRGAGTGTAGTPGGGVR